MRIGLDGWCPEDADLFREFDVRATKLALSAFDEDWSDDFFAKVEGAAADGLQVIVDLRPGEELHQALTRSLTKPDETLIETCIDRIREASVRVAQRLDGIVSDFEFWGEADCPYVGGFYPSGSMNYPAILPACYEGIKSVLPEARVWNGGYGVNFQREFLTAIVGAAPQAFDVANWHHYNVTHYAPLVQDENGFEEPDMSLPAHRRVHYSVDLYAKMFRAARAEMDAAGCTQPFASSEWGMPIVADEAVDEYHRAAGLQHFVFQDGYFGLCDADAAQYLDAWLTVFEEAGLQTLIYHRLHDSMPHGPDGDGTFWGVYCGLFYQDGTPKKRCLEVFRKWVDRGNSR